MVLRPPGTVSGNPAGRTNVPGDDIPSNAAAASEPPGGHHVEKTITCAEQNLDDSIRHAIAIKKESDLNEHSSLTPSFPFKVKFNDWSDKNPPVKQEQDSPTGDVRASDPMEISESESGEGRQQQGTKQTSVAPGVSTEDADSDQRNLVEPRRLPLGVMHRECSSSVNGVATERPGSTPRRVSDSPVLSTATGASTHQDLTPREDVPSAACDGGSQVANLVRRASTIGTDAEPATTAPTAPRGQFNATSTRPRLERLKISPTLAVSFGQSQSPHQRRDITHVVAKHRVERTAASPTAVSSPGRIWSKMSRNKFGKAARNEPDPSPAQLELQRPSEWTPFRLQPSHKTNNVSVNDNADDGLFVSEGDEDGEIHEEVENHNEQRPSEGPHAASLPQSPVLHQTNDSGSRRFSLPTPPIQLQDSPPQPGEHMKQTVPLGSFKVRTWNVGDILCQVSYGDPREEIGDVRLCNMNMEARRTIYALKSQSRIEVHFDDLCDIERYNSITQDTGQDTLFNGCLVGYPDTDQAVNRFAEFLRERDLVAIFRVPYSTTLTLLCYPAGSKSFGFLDRYSYSYPDGALHIAAHGFRLPLDVFRPDYRPQRNSREEDNDDGDRLARPERFGRFGSPTRQETRGFLAGKHAGTSGSEASKTASPKKRVPESPASMQQSPQTQRLQTPDVQVTKTPDHEDPFNRQHEDSTLGRRPDPSIKATIPPTPRQDPETPRRNSMAVDSTSTITRISPARDPRRRNMPQIAPVDTKRESLVVPPQTPMIQEVEMTDAPPLDGSQMSDPHVDWDALFAQRFGMSFKKLSFISDSGRQRHANLFYLHFPKDKSGEFERLWRFLENHNVIILGNLKGDDWDKFSKSPEGVAIFHHSFVDFHDLRGLARMTRTLQFNFWSVSLGRKIKFMEGEAYFQRLFPHGGAFLMTEDVMLHDRDNAIVILAWFRDYVREKAPGSWKLMLRPNIMAWLESKFDEDPRFVVMAVLIGEIAIEGGRKRTCTACKYPAAPEDLDPFLNPFLESPIISLADIPNYGSRSEADSEDIPRGLTQEARDTDHLCEFFAGWAILHAPLYRRFTIVTSTNVQKRWLEWQHIDFIGPPELLFRRYDVKPAEYAQWLETR